MEPTKSHLTGRWNTDRLTVLRERAGSLSSTTDELAMREADSYDENLFTTAKFEEFASAH